MRERYQRVRGATYTYGVEQASYCRSPLKIYCRKCHDSSFSVSGTDRETWTVVLCYNHVAMTNTY